ncbi:metal-activated pyridoxal enzyme [Salinibacter sp. 10B]|uniref:alanine racemase n=1 Tax=Salinibacter sp. 10B TaxID=1923971 RepID=UPI000CF3F964|nr:alanine racemase [Salinibacter sp. 10B]PQJ35593.1 metal-activated pyridoxal enzyme [Salinibacter sp. 10B]
MSVDSLSTPCLLVERDRLQHNLTQMQERACVNEVALRPHIKTHKSVPLARRQRTEGAIGVTAATVKEAATFVKAGADDVRIAFPVTGPDKHEQLAVLQQSARLSCTVDSAVGAEQVSAVHAARGRPLDVLLEVDVGHGRCGVRWDEPEAAVRLARRILDLPGVRLTGILTHAGQAYDGPSGSESEAEALRRAARHERDRMLRVAAHLADANVPGGESETFEISIGSTPTMAAFQNAEHDGVRITEIRPGNYVMHDAMQVALGAATLDECALTVLTTVVSTKERPDGPDRAFVDAGKKVLTTDTGYGTDGYGIVLRDASSMTPHPDLRVAHLSEEHGWLEGPGATRLSVGDRLRIVPNHACVTVATQPRFYVVENERVVDTWGVS